MASPSIVGTPIEASTETDATSLTVNISAFGSGTLAILILGVDGNPTITSSGGLFTEFGTRDDHGTAFVVSFWYRELDGTETNAVFNFGAAEKAAAIAYEISGAASPGTQVPEVATFQSPATSFDPDPPNITPTGGTKDYLFLAGCIQDGEEADDDTWVNSLSSGYTLSSAAKTTGIGGAAGTNVSLTAFGRQATVSSENPGTFNLDQLKNYVSFTIAIHPGAPADPHPIFHIPDRIIYPGPSEN